MIQFYFSKFTPGVRGSQIGWDKGEKATYTGKTGEKSTVIVDSAQVVHKDAPPGAHCCEVIFPDGSRWCVDADQLSPIFTAEEAAAVERIKRGEPF